MADVKQVIAVRKDLGMRKGKMIAQGAHAALEAAERSEDPDLFKEWKQTGQTKIAVGVDSESQLVEIFAEAKNKELPAYLVQDAGHTELEPGTHTAFAIGPERSQVLDHFTGNLPLL